MKKQGLLAAGPGTCQISKVDLKDIADSCDDMYQITVPTTIPKLGLLRKNIGTDITR